MKILHDLGTPERILHAEQGYGGVEHGDERCCQAAAARADTSNRNDRRDRLAGSRGRTAGDRR